MVMECLLDSLTKKCYAVGMKYLKDEKGTYYIDRVGNIDIKIYKENSESVWKEFGIFLIIVSIIGSLIVGTLVSGILGFIIGFPAMIYILGKLAEVSEFK